MKKFLGIFILGVALLWNTNAQAQEMLQIKGSDTLINLVQNLAEEYMAANPGAWECVGAGGMVRRLSIY